LFAPAFGRFALALSLLPEFMLDLRGTRADRSDAPMEASAPRPGKIRKDVEEIARGHEPVPAR
jgi:hypothetical protein